MKNDEITARRAFVEGPLAQLCRALGRNVVLLHYVPGNDSTMEYVKISFKGGGTRWACIECDSLMAIANDVLRRC